MRTLIAAFFIILFGIDSYGQNDSVTYNDTSIYRFELRDGKTIIGHFIEETPIHVTIRTSEGREIHIAKAGIKKVKVIRADAIKPKEFYEFNGRFSSNYFFNKNALPTEKGESYMQLHLFGPQFHISINEHWDFGVFTSWIASPFLFDVSYKHQLAEGLHISVGSYLGTGSWKWPEVAGAIPFAMITSGNRRYNASIGIYWGGILHEGEVEEWRAGSASFMLSMGPKAGFVFDAIFPISTNGVPNFDTELDVMAVIPGFRLVASQKVSLQFGPVITIDSREITVLPIPMVQLFIAI